MRRSPPRLRTIDPGSPAAASPAPPAQGFVESAVVRAVDPASGALTLALASADGEALVAARCAVAGGYEPREGDTVLVATERRGQRFVVGVVAALRVAAPAPVLARDGARAQLEAGPRGEERLAVRDARGALLFEYRPEERRAVVYAPEGDLALEAPHGDVRVRAGGALRVEADAAHLRVREAKVEARVLEAAAELVRTVATDFELEATQLVERVRNAYRDAEELHQQRAGRMRLLAATTFHLLGKRTFLKAEEDMKIKGEEIHLA